MKTKLIIAVALSVVIAASVYTVGAISNNDINYNSSVGENTEDKRADNAIYIDSSEIENAQIEPYVKDGKVVVAEKTSDKLFEAHSQGKMPVIVYSEEEKNQMIEDRKILREKNAGISQPEDPDDPTLPIKKKVKVQEDIAVKLVEDAGLYPDGVDRVKFEADEDYAMDFFCKLCRAYNEHKDELTSSDSKELVEYLNDSYDTITSWFPQSEETMTAYETIEKTIPVKHYSTMVERR